MSKSLKHFKSSIKEVILGPLFKVIEVIFELLVPVIVAQIIDRGINVGGTPDKQYILMMSLLLVGFAIVGFGCAVIAQYFSAKAAVHISTSIRNDLFNKIQNLSQEQLNGIGTSTLMTRLTSDINQIQSGINMALRLLLRSPIVVFGAVAVAFFIDIKAGFIFLIVVPILFLVIFLIMYICVPKYKAAQERLDTTVRLSRENLNGVRVIRAFNSEEKEIENYKKANESLKRSQLFVNRLSAITNPLTYVILNAFVIGLIYYGAIQVNSGELTSGNVVALYNLISQILVESIKFANLIALISKAIASMKRVDSILDMEIVSDVKDSDKTDEHFISFKNVSMSYHHNGKYAVENISFDVNKGETIGIIGGTGSGKTTLADLILKTYVADEGDIYIDGKDIKSIESKDVKELVSLVPQKAVLFKGTIKENLLWGNKDASLEDIEKAIEIAQASDIIAKKDKGIDEEVEQEGRNFSGGQKQRLCIARALVKKAPILILDDSSSALDYQTDANLRKAIKNSTKELTTFIISQRTASIAHADKILVLDNGKLVGLGKHDELLTSCAIYKEIYDSQFKKEEAK